jgi:predicted deacylase
MKKIAAAVGGFVLVLLTSLAISPKQIDTQPLVQPPGPVQPISPTFPSKPSITNPMPAYLDYSKTVQQLEKWKAEAPGLVETGTYGKSARGINIHYIRITNLYDAAPKKKVLITSCIHGNEPLSASTTMAFIGAMLKSYGTDPAVTELINSRDIYFVPVVSPDSYPNSRHVDGVDPNRDFPGPSNPTKQSTPSIKALQNFFLTHRFNAVMSGHTHGRVYLTPHGDKTQLCPNDVDFKRIVGDMSTMSKYRVQRACQMYNKPIFGTEIDWYYRNGAFAIVCEFGTHQSVPSMADIQDEFNRTYKATLHFIKEAPLVQIQPSVLFEAKNFDFSIFDFKERTRLLGPAPAIEVLNVPFLIRFGVMGVPTTNDLALTRFSKLDSFVPDVFSTP